MTELVPGSTVHDGAGSTGTVLEVRRFPVMSTSINGNAFVQRIEEQVFVDWGAPQTALSCR